VELRWSGKAKVGSEAKKTLRRGGMEGESEHRDRTAVCSRHVREVADTREVTGKLCTQENPVVHTAAAGVGGWRVASVWEEEDPPTESGSRDG
jgi:hypothetical protein